MSGPRAQDSRKSCRSTRNKLLGKLEQASASPERGLFFELRACARQVWIGVGAVAIECESNVELGNRSNLVKEAAGSDSVTSCATGSANPSGQTLDKLQSDSTYIATWLHRQRMPFLIGRIMPRMAGQIWQNSAK
jgi:hypothetical protein